MRRFTFSAVEVRGLSKMDPPGLIHPTPEVQVGLIHPRWICPPSERINPGVDKFIRPESGQIHLGGLIHGGGLISGGGLGRGGLIHGGLIHPGGGLVHLVD